jgi:hypothetical protein
MYFSLLPTSTQSFEIDPVKTVEQITSSKDELPQLHDSFIGSYREYRAFKVKYTLTSTSYVFSSTVIKNTVTLANDGNLLCLPEGFTIC